MPKPLDVTGVHLLTVVVNGFSLEEPGAPSHAAGDEPDERFHLRLDVFVEGLASRARV